jgi:hypothetical protein
MSKKLEVAKGKDLAPIDLVIYARQSFGQMQRNWWEFAKSIYKIREEQAYSKEFLGAEDGHNTFKDFCFQEYPTVDLSTIYKFCSIVEDWKDLMDSKIKKDPLFELPSYESCYRLSVVKNSLAKEELSRLRKALIDSNISYRGLQEQLKDLVSRKTKEALKSVDEVEETVRKKVEASLEEELKDEDLDTEDFTGLDDPETDLEGDDEDIMADDDESDSSVVSCTLRAKYLIDNLPSVEIFMKKGSKKTKDLEDLAASLEELSDIANNFFTKYEKLK